VHCVLLERDGQSKVILAAWSRFGADEVCNGEVVVSSWGLFEQWRVARRKGWHVKDGLVMQVRDTFLVETPQVGALACSRLLVGLTSLQRNRCTFHVLVPEQTAVSQQVSMISFPVTISCLHMDKTGNRHVSSPQVRFCEIDTEPCTKLRSIPTTEKQNEKRLCT
jgi:hypothetical protein